jgi:hypothetical protein
MSQKHYHLVRSAPKLGDDVPAKATTPSISSITSNPTVKLATGAALTYHGYKRTGSVLWALAYGLAGRMFPVVAIPVAAAQGFGKSKGGGS